MRTYNSYRTHGYRTRTVLALLAGLGTAFCLSVTPVQAQTDEENEENVRDRATKQYIEPTVPQFPFAPPANQHLYHYRGLDRINAVPGSAKNFRERNEAREAQRQVEILRRDRDARLTRMGITQEEDALRMAEPVVPQFPFAPPANQHLYHYMGLTRNYAMPGSAFDMLQRRQAERDAMALEVYRRDRESRLARMNMTVEQEDLLFAPPTVPMFPYAPPANQHLYHYRGLDRRYAVPGSASDARYYQQRRQELMYLEWMGYNVDEMRRNLRNPNQIEENSDNR